MNTAVTVHPKLHHYGLITTNLNAMIDWYRKVLGMTLNHRAAMPKARNAPFSAMAFVSNDEADHRIVLFEMPGVPADPNRRGRGSLQHVAFQCETFDDLLGTYARLKGLGILPQWAADHGLGTAIYYADPDGNIVEINVNNYGNAWTATEHMKTVPTTMMQVDPDKMIAARKAGASAWALHERADAGEFAPAKPFEGRALM
ncbi:MAG: VOC family protein [Steroidobacteraceae bacterium]